MQKMPLNHNYSRVQDLSKSSKKINVLTQTEDMSNIPEDFTFLSVIPSRSYKEAPKNRKRLDVPGVTLLDTNNISSQTDIIGGKNPNELDVNTEWANQHDSNSLCRMRCANSLCNGMCKRAKNHINEHCCNICLNEWIKSDSCLTKLISCLTGLCKK